MRSISKSKKNSLIKKRGEETNVKIAIVATDRLVYDFISSLKVTVLISVTHFFFIVVMLSVAGAWGSSMGAGMGVDITSNGNFLIVAAAPRHCHCRVCSQSFNWHRPNIIVVSYG